MCKRGWHPPSWLLHDQALPPVSGLRPILSLINAEACAVWLIKMDVALPCLTNHPCLYLYLQSPNARTDLPCLSRQPVVVEPSLSASSKFIIASFFSSCCSTLHWIVLSLSVMQLSFASYQLLLATESVLNLSSFYRLGQLANGNYRTSRRNVRYKLSSKAQRSLKSNLEWFII